MKKKLIELVEKVGVFLEKKRLQADWSLIDKGAKGIATSADIEAEAMIVSFLKTHYPHIDCWGEEEAKNVSLEDIKNNKQFWLIDPIDGTNNYVNKLPIYCISIALCEGEDVKLALVYNPATNEYFYAEKGQGAFYFNGVSESFVQYKKSKKIEECLFSPGRLRGHREAIGIERQLDYFQKNARAIRRLGTAAWEICLVASGQLDGFWQFGLKPWDIAAAILITKEAGLKVVDFHGQEAIPLSQTIAVLPDELFSTSLLK